MNAAIAGTQFYLYGRRHFRKAGYALHKKEYDSPVQSMASIRPGEEGSDGIDLKDKVIVITGANSGIGKEMTTYAAAKGANVYMICRSKERAEKARDEIVMLTANKQIYVVLADVGEYHQVRAAAKEINSKEQIIDCLVCNAGVLLNDKHLTSEGNEVTIASHLIGGSYLLSQLLLPQLQASDDPRVIFTTSGGMYNTKFPSWNVATCKTDAKYNGNMSYSYAKRGQVLLAEQNSKIHPKIRWVTGHPGWTSTTAVDDAFGANKKYLEPMRDTWEGAEGLSWLMGVQGEKIINGALYLDRKPQRKHMAGPFFTDGEFTKNSEAEIQELMKNLKNFSSL